MGTARYFVQTFDDTWLITLDGGVVGRYRSRQEAVAAAIVMADLMGAMHHDADVMMAGDGADGLAVVWTYGIDPVPQSAVRRVTGTQ